MTATYTTDSPENPTPMRLRHWHPPIMVVPIQRGGRRLQRLDRVAASLCRLQQRGGGC
ncbi:hypothetical protein [Kaistia terrae]|jgi:hypothetical protein|uniref:Uncharacterized protein n=1 Tax=Kaistia terrae TaxID=537017 RepID=A0ABW0PWX7_9HYPH|nr:hypothetical protein [Kaistia terrae]MCX5580980.1 hypothetical protein [Kaistia terrae]